MEITYLLHELIKNKKFCTENINDLSTLMSKNIKIDNNSEGKQVNHKYFSWKQYCVALSSTKANYVVISGYAAQILYMMHTHEH